MLKSNEVAAGGEEGLCLSAVLKPGKNILLQSGALITSLSIALTFVIVFAIRGGLGDNFGALAILVASALLPIWLPVWALNKYGKTALTTAISGAAGLMIGVLLPLFGLAGGRYAGWLNVALLLIALGANGRAFKKSTAAMGFKTLLSLSIFVLLLLVSTGPQRLFLPEMMTLGTASSDSYFHAAIAQMILHFNIPSIGADGLIYHHYHVLSHALAAGLAEACNMSVPLVYLYWGGLVLKAQLVWCFYTCLVLFSPSTTRSDGAISLHIFCYAWLSAVLIAGLDSEAFLLSLVLLFALLPLIVALMEVGDQEPSVPIGLALVCFGALFCAGAKVSAGFFVAIALIVIAWNIKRRWLLVAAIGLTFLALAALAKLALVPRDLTMTASSRATVLWSYMQYLTPETVFSYALPIFVIVLLTHANKSAAAPADTTPISRMWRKALQANNLVKFLVLATLGCVVILFTSLIGSNIQYFSAILYAIALLLLPTVLARVPATKAFNNWYPAILGVLLTACLMPTLSNLPADAFTTITNLFQRSERPDGHVRISEDVAKSLRQTHSPFAFLNGRIADTTWARLMRVAEAENARVGGRLAVQIQPDAEDVWRRLKNGSPWWCMAPQLMIPAQTGIVEIRSAPPKAIETVCAPPGTVWYGFGESQDSHRAANLTDSQVCSLAKPDGIREVYRLHSFQDLSKNSMTRCG